MTNAIRQRKQKRVHAGTKHHVRYHSLSHRPPMTVILCDTEGAVYQLAWYTQDDKTRSCLLNYELIGLPDTTCYPKPAVDDLSVSAIGCLHGAKHAKAVLARINLLGALGAEQRVEDVGRAGQRATSSHLEAKYNH